MPPVRAAVAALVALAMISLAPSAGRAAGAPNILIIGADADPATAPAKNRVYKRVSQTLSAQLASWGFNAFDETAVTLASVDHDVERRSDAALLEIARGVREPPIDLLVVFSIFPRTEPLTYTTKVYTRVEGRVMSLTTGQRFAYFEAKSPDDWRVKPGCERDANCILEAVGDRAAILGKEVGEALAIKINSYLTAEVTPAESADAGDDETRCMPSAFSLVFDNFSPEDLRTAEDNFTIFYGYKDHRVTYSSLTRREYWYESCITATRLNRNFGLMLDHLGVKGRVVLSDRNRFTVQRILE